ncbi:DUF6801 domain-containing protein [Streptomyces sp. NPDC049970]|uniref:DUF6801 domain-containing protein n=1 Tax=Streptomyces sp. NPDC049970 TaxID=3155033 RepID=UPI003449F272
MATAVLLGGMIPGAQAAPGVQKIEAELAYTCDFPEGPQPVEAVVTAEIPGSARAGEVIQPEGVSVELAFPEAVPAELARAGAATVSAEARLSVGVAQEGREARAEWNLRTGEPVPLPEAGGLTLTTSGSVPYVKPGASGELHLDASALSVELALKQAGGAPAEPPDTTVECTPDAEQETGLATVEVSGADGEGASEPAPSETWPGQEEETPGEAAPEVGVGARPKASAADVPPCTGDPEDAANMVAYVTGYANVTKLDGATRFPVACGNITQGAQWPSMEDGVLHFYQYSTVDLEYRGKPQLPPASGTFLTFGFMPTTATLEMTQIPTGTDADGVRIPNIESDLAILPTSSRNRTTITLDLMLRLRDVEVNGVPLDVGSNCRTSKPFKLTLEGLGTWGPDGLVGYTLVSGGELTGSVTIPPFSGCGATEDLDDIFTASLSGVPNYVKQVQGAPCASANGADPAFCTPDYQPVDIPEAAR